VNCFYECTGRIFCRRAVSYVLLCRSSLLRTNAVSDGEFFLLLMQLHEERRENMRTTKMRERKHHICPWNYRLDCCVVCRGVHVTLTMLTRCLGLSQPAVRGCHRSSMFSRISLSVEVQLHYCFVVHSQFYVVVLWCVYTDVQICSC